MAFLDFINKRNASQQQPVAEKSQQRKPETAQQMYGRRATEEKANRKPVDQMIPEADKAQAKELGQRIDRLTQGNRPEAPPPPTAPSDANSPEPMRQVMTGQDNAAPARSPTSAQSGKTILEKATTPASKETSAITPEKANTRPQTLARTTPSWER